MARLALYSLRAWATSPRRSSSAARSKWLSARLRDQLPVAGRDALAAAGGATGAAGAGAVIGRARALRAAAGVRDSAAGASDGTSLKRAVGCAWSEGAEPNSSRAEQAAVCEKPRSARPAAHAEGRIWRKFLRCGGGTSVADWTAKAMTPLSSAKRSRFL